jgi:hypothetical protein
MKLSHDQRIDLYNFQKHDREKSGKITGQAMLVNKTKYAIIDIDIDKKLPESEIEKIRNNIIEKIEETQDECNGKLPRIVITGNGGLHLYSLWDKSLPLEKGRSCDVFKHMKNRLNYDVDIFTPIDPEKMSLLVLPGTKIKGAADGSIKTYMLWNEAEDDDLISLKDLYTLLEEKFNLPFSYTIVKKYMVQKAVEKAEQMMSENKPKISSPKVSTQKNHQKKLIIYQKNYLML